MPWWTRVRRAVAGSPTIDWRAEATAQAELRVASELEADALRDALQHAAVELRKADELLRVAADAASAALREAR